MMRFAVDGAQLRHRPRCRDRRRLHRPRSRRGAAPHRRAGRHRGAAARLVPRLLVAAAWLATSRPRRGRPARTRRGEAELCLLGRRRRPVRHAGLRPHRPRRRGDRHRAVQGGLPEARRRRGVAARRGRRALGRPRAAELDRRARRRDEVLVPGRTCARRSCRRSICSPASRTPARPLRDADRHGAGRSAASAPPDGSAPSCTTRRRDRSIHLAYDIESLSGSPTPQEDRSMRTGADYRAALDDGRTVILDGEHVDNVANHPAFSGVVDTDRPPLRRRRRPGPARPVHLPVADRRQPGAPLVEDPDRARRPRRPSPGDRRLGRGDVRVPRPQPRPRGQLLRRVRRLAVDVRRGRPASSPTTSRGSTPRPATRACTSATRSSTRPSIGPRPPQEPVRAERLRQRGATSATTASCCAGAQMLGTGSVMSDYIFVSCILPLPEGARTTRSRCVVPNNARRAADLLPPPLRRREPGRLRLPAELALRRDRLAGGLRRRLRALGATCSSTATSS